jgi:hypothetical protein
VAWFRVVSNRLQYRGRLSRAPYLAWAQTAEGAETIDARVTRDRLYLLAHSRAQRRLWRELDRASRGEFLRKAIQSEAEHFATVVSEACYAPGLPRLTIALHRLVIVPRSVVAARARTALRRRLYDSEALAPVDPCVREFFFDQLVREFDAAIGLSRPSVFRPVLTRDAWACVGRDTEYRWVDPMFSGPAWGGHFLMFEFPSEGLSRKRRKEVDRGVHDLQDSLANISYIRRDAIVRMAVDALPRLTA